MKPECIGTNFLIWDYSGEKCLGEFTLIGCMPDIYLPGVYDERVLTHFYLLRKDDRLYQLGVDGDLKAWVTLCEISHSAKDSGNSVRDVLIPDFLHAKD